MLQPTRCRTPRISLGIVDHRRALRGARRIEMRASERRSLEEEPAHGARTRGRIVVGEEAHTGAFPAGPSWASAAFLGSLIRVTTVAGIVGLIHWRPPTYARSQRLVLIPNRCGILADLLDEPRRCDARAPRCGPRRSGLTRNRRPLACPPSC